VTKDQILPLYLLLYPFLVSDFSHRSDIQNWAMDMKEEMKKVVEDLDSKLNMHTHVGNLGYPTSTTKESVPSIIFNTQIWRTQPEDDKYVFAEKLIVSSSPYSKNMVHRDPLVDNENVKDKGREGIPVQFRKVVGSVPFDISGLEDEFLTGNEYAGSEIGN